MRWLVSEPGYMFSSSSKPGRVRLGSGITAMACLLLALAWTGAGSGEDGKPGPSPDGAREGYRRIDVALRTAWNELELAKADGPYLTLDLGRREIHLRLKGILVWSCPMRYANPDSEVMGELEAYLADGHHSPVAKLTGKHLYTARERFPDSMLTVVARVARVTPEQLQRYEPGHFELMCGRRLVIDVRTDADAQPKSRLGNAIAAVRSALMAPMTDAKIAISIEPDDALTLYGAARRHIPVLICPAAR
jgi:hypothetical protein